MPYPSGVFKAKAREALMNHWQTALLIALIVNLPTLLAQGIAVFTGNDIARRSEDLLIALMRDGQLDNAHILDGLTALMNETGIWLMIGLRAVAWIITPVLSLGMTHWLLLRLRKKEAGVDTVFSRLPVFLKSIGLHLLTALKTLLWMLPGAAVSMLSVIPLLGARGGDNEAVYSALTTGSMLIYAGMGIMLVLGVMAALRYALAEYKLADEPETGVLACIRESKRVMAGKKGALLSLELSFIFWYLGEYMVSSLLTGFGGGVLSLMFQMLAGMALSVYITCSVGSFYLLTQTPDTGAAETDESEASGEDIGL